MYGFGGPLPMNGAQPLQPAYRAQPQPPMPVRAPGMMGSPPGGVASGPTPMGAAQPGMAPAMAPGMRPMQPAPMMQAQPVNPMASQLTGALQMPTRPMMR